MAIDILCRVVDNFGDIGVAWRLAKAVRAYDRGVDLRLVVDDLAAFAALHPGIDPAAPVQADPVATVLRWDAAAAHAALPPARMAVETFQCGLPDWYGRRFHDPLDPDPRLHVCLDYLSAEDYAAEFHLMPSLSPSPAVRRLFAMPGFAAGTGGLILDPGFLAARGRWRAARRSGALPAARRDWLDGLALGPAAADFPDGGFWLSVFSYERDYAPLLRDLPRWRPDAAVLLAAGRSAGPFLAAWEAAGRPLPVLALPFLPQESWDEAMLACDCNIVRGEESLARACLSGLPFLWQAYLQDGGHQAVKSAALARRVAGHLPPGPAAAAWLALQESLNRREADSAAAGADDDYLALLPRLGELAPGFAELAAALEKLGDIAQLLLSLYAEI